MDMTKTWESAFLEKILAGTDKAAFDPKDTEKYYLREMKELKTRADAVINTHYEGQGYMPVDLMVELINQIKLVAGQKVAVFDRISALMMKMVGCDVTLFDKGAGFVNSGMKFDIVVGNPPFSAPKNIEDNCRGAELFPLFYKKAIEMANVVAMIMPTSDKKAAPKHNKLLRETANVIHHINDDVFIGISTKTWYVIAQKGNISLANNVRWISDKVGNNIPWKKGKVNMTGFRKVYNGYFGTEERVHEDQVIFYQKMSRNGPVVRYFEPETVSLRARFPDTGYAVIMPHCIGNDGWKWVEVVKCDGKQCAGDSENVVFFDTLSEANDLVARMKTKQFIDGANEVKQRQGAMTTLCLKAITI